METKVIFSAQASPTAALGRQVSATAAAGIDADSTSAGIAADATSAGINADATSAGIDADATSAGIDADASSAGIDADATSAGIDADVTFSSEVDLMESFCVVDFANQFWCLKSRKSIFLMDDCGK
jgi:hypothetical protein